MDSLRISKRLLVATLAVCRQLARSLDASLHDKWHLFLEFFGEDELTTYASVRRELEALHGVDCLPSSTITEPRELSLIERLLARGRFLFCDHVHIPRNDLSFVILALRRAGDLVASAERPDESEIAESRMQLSAGEFLVEQRIAQKTVRMVQDIDHFNSSTYFDHRSIRELLETQS